MNQGELGHKPWPKLTRGCTAALKIKGSDTVAYNRQALTTKIKDTKKKKVRK